MLHAKHRAAADAGPLSSCAWYLDVPPAGPSALEAAFHKATHFAARVEGLRPNSPGWATSSSSARARALSSTRATSAADPSSRGGMSQ
jgi:hypothetical protein